MVADRGRVSTGLVVSWTVTVKLHGARPHEVAASQETVVSPIGKEAPELAEQDRVEPAEHEGEPQVAVALLLPEHSATTGAGQVMVGALGAVTVMVKEPEAWLPAWSVAVHETVVTPTGKL